MAASWVLKDFPTATLFEAKMSYYLECKCPHKHHPWILWKADDRIYKIHKVLTQDNITYSCAQIDPKDDDFARKTVTLLARQ